MLEDSPDARGHRLVRPASALRTFALKFGRLVSRDRFGDEALLRAKRAAVAVFSPLRGQAGRDASYRRNSGVFRPER